MELCPLQVNSISLTNYRCFKQLSIDFHPHLTVVVAKNGNGKTAVLDAIAVALGPFIGSFDEAKGAHFSASDVRLSRNPNLALVEMEAQYPLSMTVKGIVQGAHTQWDRELASAKSHTTYANARALSEYGKYLQSSVRFAADGHRSSLPILPIVAYYGTGRLWGEMRLSAGRRANLQTSRTAGYSDCLTSTSRYKAFADWFERLCRAEYDERDNAVKLGAIQEQLRAIRGAVDTVLRPSGWHSIAFKSADVGIVVSHSDQGALPVDWLSDGIRNLAGLAADIAYRAVRLNSHLGEAAVRQTPGVVLIDEVDMHLHPEWQQVVLASFREAFPLVQFIVTTHSPQLLTSVRRENIRLLHPNGKAVLPNDGTLGAESVRVLESIFGVHSRPQGVETVVDLRRYLELVELGKAKEAEAVSLRTKIEESLGTNDPDLQLADVRASQLEFLERK